jgi:hypothetical protein
MERVCLKLNNKRWVKQRLDPLALLNKYVRNGSTFYRIRKLGLPTIVIVTIDESSKDLPPLSLFRSTYRAIL